MIFKLEASVSIKWYTLIEYRRKKRADIRWIVQIYEKVRSYILVSEQSGVCEMLLENLVGDDCTT
jgi:hypothetical protein